MIATMKLFVCGGRQWFLALSWLSVVSFAADAHGQVPARSMPNVVVIVADDIGMGDIQAMGGRVATPNIDSLLNQGMNFTDAHTATSQCHPTRFALVTGSNSYRTGRRYGFSLPQGNALLTGGQRWNTLGDVIKGVKDESGQSMYSTSFMGKMSLGLPALSQHGYDHAYGLPTGGQVPPNMIIDENAELITDDNGTPLSDGMFSGSFEEFSPLGAVMAGEARSFIESNTTVNRPFYLHYNIHQLHAPHRPPDTFTTYDGTVVPVRHSPDLNGRPLGWVSGELRHMDLQVGYILDTLEAEGVADDTLIVFTSDNGATYSLEHLQIHMPEGHYSAGSVMDSQGQMQRLRTGKADMWEAGHRVPFIAKWGDGTPAGSVIQPGTVNENLVSTNDLMATFYDLTGQAIESNQALDSVSILPTLLDTSAVVRTESYLHSSGIATDNLVGAWRMDDAEGEWVVLFEQTILDSRGDYGLHVLEGLEVAEFYNLTDDPGQLNNLLSANIEIDDNEIPSEAGLAAITDPNIRQRVAFMVNQFFSFWEKDDPRTSVAVDYSIAANQTPIPGWRQLGDTNGDGLVDIDDLNSVRNNFGAAGAADGSLAGDAFPFDGLVNIDDINAVRNNFGGGSAVPEPSALILTLLGLTWLGVGSPRRAA